VKTVNARRRFLLALAAVTAAGSPARAAAPVRVFAAASLKSALDEIATAYREAGGERVSLSYAATSVLARQIEQGAPCDLFIAADLDWMDDLAARGKIIAASRVDLLGNTLVLIAPADSPLAVTLRPGVDLAGVLGPQERIAIADPAAVPAGRYARRALETLGVWAAVEDRLATADNVRAALAFVARKAAPLGIVYGSDAVAEPAVRVLDRFAPETHPPIIYPAALVEGGLPAAAAFLAYLQSPAAAARFRRWGFAPRFG
jgi:molybdate transport system substrate-binding protein